MRRLAWTIYFCAASYEEAFKKEERWRGRVEQESGKGASGAGIVRQKLTAERVSCTYAGRWSLLDNIGIQWKRLQFETICSHVDNSLAHRKNAPSIARSSRYMILSKVD